ncbi:MAG: phytoene desaturase family protein [Leptolyngbyaceae cyanobacterium]
MARAETTDIVVIGSGVGGLCCSALLAKYGFEVTVCESHSLPGGAAHGFKRQGFTFDSGPSLYSGLSYRPSTNPLRQVMDAIGVDLEWATYDTWGCRLPEGDFDTQVGAMQFCDVLQRLRGSQAVAEWQRLQRVMEPLKKAAIALPPAAMRLDLAALLSVGSFLPQMAPHALQMARLTGPFSTLMESVVTDPFVRNWLDLLCFLLSGLPADGTLAAEIAFMFGEWYRPDVTLDYPIGGSGALVDALVRGLTQQGGQLLLNAHVEQVTVAGGRATGVRLADGRELRAREAVIANASIWDTLKLLPAGVMPPSFIQTRQATPQCASFMHLHLGIDATHLPDNLACHYIVVNDWDLGIDAPQNVVLISIPSLLDPSLAPAGCHTLHVYTPGNEPYDLWQGVDRQSAVYETLKKQRAEVMWQALERVIPDVRSRCWVNLVGTPLTHERFLRRHQGTYGPAFRAGAQLFPGPNTPLPGFWCCGDSTFPGIGLPAVATSGMIVANTIAPINKHLDLLRSLSSPTH